MDTITTVIDAILASKFAATALAMLWLLLERKERLEAKKQYQEDRTAWLLRVEKLTDALRALEIGLKS